MIVPMYLVHNSLHIGQMIIDKPGQGDGCMFWKTVDFSAPRVEVLRLILMA